MEKLIIKFGTESLLGEDGLLNQTIFDEAARQIAAVRKQGVATTIVSSGAIQAGREVALQLKLSTDSLHKKDLAGIGATKLLSMWSEAFLKEEIAVAQVWLTHASICHFAERKSIEASLDNYLRAGVVAIVNENDVVSAREIEFMEQGLSENDQLTRLVSEVIKPEMVMFVTSVGGVFEQNPKIHAEARMYQELDCATLPTQLLEATEKSASGSGGMGKKIIEAAKCFDGKRRVVIANLKNEQIMRFAGSKKEVGTRLGCQNRL